MQCEMCGKLAELLTVDVEGTDLNVCSSCTNYGKIKRNFVSSQSLNQQFSKRNDFPEYKVVSDYASLIRSARENKSMSHKDFSKLINEREALISKWESGGLIPSVDSARKLEKIIGISLVQEDILISIPLQKKFTEELTLGDFIKVRKRK